MKFLKLVVGITMVIGLVGCSYQNKIFFNGKPIMDNVAYSYNSNTGIDTQSVLIRKYKVTEDDESYTSNEYYAPIEQHKFKKSNTEGIIYSISVDNTKHYKAVGQGFYYNIYQILKVINHTRKTLSEDKDLMYSGHLSHKNFAFELPNERGDEVNCYYEFVDKDQNFIFRTLDLNYEVN